MKTSVMDLPANDVASSARGFARFRVVRRVQESLAIVSFELVPVDDQRPLSFLAGQFVALRVPLPGGESVLRHYSLSGNPADTTHWRISVKLENEPPGLGSTFLHREVGVGDELDLAGPTGAFVCADTSDRPVILMSGGVGATPLVSMLHRLARSSSRRVHFLHACENGGMHAFSEEVRALAALRAGIDVHVCYRHPLGTDVERGAYDSQGTLTKQTLQSLLPLDDYEVYMCGPPGFMQANWRLLRELGVARERIHYEFFGPATVLGEQPTAELEQAAMAPGVLTAPTPCAPPAVGTGTALTVRFQPGAEPTPWDSACPSLLDMAEQAGYAPAFNCRVGICNACMTPLLEGRVDYIEEPLTPPSDGQVLLCCARPVTAVTLALPPVRS